MTAQRGDELVHQAFELLVRLFGFVVLEEADHSLRAFAHIAEELAIELHPLECTQAIELVVGFRFPRFRRLTGGLGLHCVLKLAVGVGQRNAHVFRVGLQIALELLVVFHQLLAEVAHLRVAGLRLGQRAQVAVHLVLVVELADELGRRERRSLDLLVGSVRQRHRRRHQRGCHE